VFGRILAGVRERTVDSLVDENPRDRFERVFLGCLIRRALIMGSLGHSSDVLILRGGSPYA
jgi:hypothetical protein